MPVGNGKRCTTVGTLAVTIALFGLANMTYYTKNMLPILTPFTASSLVNETPTNLENDTDKIYSALNDQTKMTTYTRNMLQISAPFNDSSKVKEDATAKQYEIKEEIVGETPSTEDHVKEEIVYKLNDQTISWPDWATSRQQDAPAQILLTNYGWNHPNQTKGLTFARSIRSKQLLEGILQHPWFRPVTWDEVSPHPTNKTTYVFLDIEMCFESNWPYYGGERGYFHNGGGLNVDIVGNRSMTMQRNGNCCQFQRRALNRPISQSPNVRLVLFDCSGRGMSYCCLRERNKEKTTVVSISAESSLTTDHDLGLPPPAGKQINLTQEQVKDIENCKEESRPLLYSFAGSFTRGNLRRHLKPFHNGKDVLVVRNTQQVNMTYEDFLTKAKFVGTPKGDNLFSYRFTEAMSAGAIPVVHADDWVLPFSSKLINWNKCAVLIPEAQVRQTMSILSSIPESTRCEMRKCVLDAYQQYMSSPGGTIEGIIKSLELAGHQEDILTSQLNKVQEQFAREEEKDESPVAIGMELSVQDELTVNTAEELVREQQMNKPVYALNDKTIPWPDWSSSLQQQPEGQILLTTYGWNHPDQAKGLTFARSIRSKQLIDGILKHSWFRPVSWDEVSLQPTNITTYVFLDVETCFERNWPHYGGHGGLNVDVVGNRSTTFERDGDCCAFQHKALKQPIFQSPNIRLILFDCSGEGLAYCCFRGRNKKKTTVVSISAKASQHTPYDLGLPPPAGNLVKLTLQQIRDIETCNETSRSFLYTFAGAFGRGNVRDKLKPLHNGKDVLVLRNTRQVRLTYDQFLLKSKFTGAPRGDDLFSYRFTEAMSSGAIPVIHADDWVLPFSDKLINWEKCAVIIPEAQLNDTLTILSNISAEERCEMRRCVLHAYYRFMKTPERTIFGIIQSLELVDKHSSR